MQLAGIVSGGHYRRDYPVANPALAARTFLRLAPDGTITPVGAPVRASATPQLAGLPS